MSGETEGDVSGWTTDTLKYLLDDRQRAIERLDRLQEQRREDRQHWQDQIDRMGERFEGERDRRLSEVAIEREKALKIKETADLAALGLAREIQTYKDEKANQLREQINEERGAYLTRIEYTTQHQALIDKVEQGLLALADKVDVSLAPLEHFMVSQQGKARGIGLSANVLAGVITAFLAVVTMVVTIVLVFR